MLRRRPQPLSASEDGATTPPGLESDFPGVTVKNTFLEASIDSDDEAAKLLASLASGVNTAPASTRPSGGLKFSLAVASHSPVSKEDQLTPSTMASSPPLSPSGGISLWPPTPGSPQVRLFMDGGTAPPGLKSDVLGATLKNPFLKASVDSDDEDAEILAFLSCGVNTEPASTRPFGGLKLARAAESHSALSKEDHVAPSAIASSPPMSPSGGVRLWPPTPGTPHVRLSMEQLWPPTPGNPRVRIPISLAELMGGAESSGTTVFACVENAPAPKFAPPAAPAPANTQPSFSSGGPPPPMDAPKASQVSRARPNPRRRRRRRHAACAAKLELGE
eukprot:TRINITY_DN42288_c0_g1_i1.p1 TRINITY_DN42288_c0_g1~~TRINITY_DN42288_c0_g1_i1.p1  ORF type:complete len:333 (+),score=56.30 TRINITY_DN42288_c0_g1_i1:122-1120(+)